VSSCFSVFTASFSSWKWWLAYNDAMSYRMSHYFVSYMSEATVVASGCCSSSPLRPGVRSDAKKNDDAKGSVLGKATKWEYPVAVPTKVEVPRSLVEVVVYWNIPMHNWLKNCELHTTGPGLWFKNGVGTSAETQVKNPNHSF
jgi:porcupine-like protein